MHIWHLLILIICKYTSQCSDWEVFLTLFADTVRIANIASITNAGCAMLDDPTFSIDSTRACEAGILAFFSNACKMVWTFRICGTLWFGWKIRYSLWWFFSYYGSIYKLHKQSCLPYLPTVSYLTFKPSLPNCLCSLWTFPFLNLTSFIQVDNQKVLCKTFYLFEK